MGCKVFLGTKTGGKNFSRRVVQMRDLTGTEVGKYRRNVAELLPKDTSFTILTLEHSLYCLRASITHVSEPDQESVTKCGPLKPVSFEEMQTNFDAYFTPKDQEVLQRVYGDGHDASIAEAQEILGGVIPVVEG